MVSTQFQARVKLINYTPSGVLDFKTLHDVFGGHVSPVSVSKLLPKVFGCIVYVHVYSHQWSKLDPCTLRCVFIGYFSTHNGYKCYHLPIQKVHVTLNVTFHEEVPYYVSPSSPIQGERGNTALRKETTGRTEASDQSPHLKMKNVVFVKKRPIALWNSTGSPYLEMKQVLSVSK
ncbi:unnamed protein product [Prunus armeniaca]